MDHIISLSSIPSWARLELVREIKDKITKENLAIEIPQIEDKAIVHNDFPADIFIQGTTTALAALMPFIYHWLLKKKVECEIKEEDGKTIITIRGHDIDRIMEVRRKVLSGTTND